MKPTNSCIFLLASSLDPPLEIILVASSKYSFNFAVSFSSPLDCAFNNASFKDTISATCGDLSSVDFASGFASVLASGFASVLASGFAAVFVSFIVPDILPNISPNLPMFLSTLSTLVVVAFTALIKAAFC